MFPTVIRKEKDKKCGCKKNQPGSASASNSITVGTNSVDVGTKYDTGFSKYHMHTGCMRLPLRGGGALNLRFNQFPGQGLGYAGVGPDSWSPAGRGGLFSFLPFIQQEYSLAIQTDEGTVNFSMNQGTVGTTVTYYTPSTPLAMRGKDDSATKRFTVTNDVTGERWIFANKSDAVIPGRLVQSFDRNGNSLVYTYRPRSGGNPSGKYNILHSITGDLVQGQGIYFGYNDVANEQGYGHVRRIIVGNGTANQDRTTYFEWDAVNDTLQRAVYPGGCSTNYEFIPAGGYIQAAIRKEVDQENYTTYFEYLNTTILRKTVEPLGRVSYYEYTAGSTTIVRAGRSATTYGSVTMGDGFQALPKTVTPDGAVTYFNYDGVTSRVKCRVDPSGATTYYRYSTNYALVSEKKVATGAETAYSYKADGQSIHAKVGPRHTVGSPVLTYFTYDNNFNILTEQNPVQAIRSSGYDAAGRRISETDPRGNVTNYRIDAQTGQMDSVLDPLLNSTYYRYNGFAERIAEVSPRWKETGNAAQFTTAMAYDQRSRLVKERDPLGNTTYFGYTPRGDLAATQDPRGVVRWSRYDGLRHKTKDAVTTASGVTISNTYYEYDAYGNRSKVIDGRGGATVMAYDAMDRLATTINALGGVTYFGYDQMGNQIKRRDPLGRSTVSVFDLVNRQVASVDALNNQTYFGYDLGDNLVKRRDARGNSSLRTYDAADRLATQTDALNSRTYFGYDLANNQVKHLDPLNRLTQFVYDKMNRRTAVIDAKSQITYFGFDAVGNVVKERNPRAYVMQHAYDANDRRSTTTDALGGVTYFGYDQVGNVVKQRDALTRTTLSTYDALNRPVVRTDALNGSTYFGYDQVGNVVKQRDPRGASTLHTYDSLNRRVTSFDPLNARTYFGYDSVGNAVKQRNALNQTALSTYDVLNRRVAMTDALNNQTYFGYDQVGNVTKRRNARGNAQTMVYDALNRPLTQLDSLGGQTYFGYDAVGNQVKVRNPLGVSALADYDELNRVRKIQDATLAKTYFVYDAAGNLTTRIDPLQRATTTTYDALNRPTVVTDVTTGATVATAYDAVGNVRKQVDPLLQATYFAYDNLNRLAQQIDPLAVRTYFVYDAGSNLTAQVVKSADVAAVQLGYDQVGRKHWFQDGISPLGTYFNYDAVGNLTSTVDQTGLTSRTYDALNRQTLVIGPRGDTTYFGYGPTSLRTKLQYPRGTIRTTFDHDALDRLRKLRSPTNRDTYYVYDAASRPTKVKLGSGAVCYYAFDAAHRPTAINHVTSAGAAIAQFTYRRDAAGRINRILRENNVAVYYQYDGADRLTSELWLNTTTQAQLYGFTYQYDLAGNRATSSRTGAGGVAIDATAYSYNSANALTKKWVTPTNQATYYAYDGAGSLRRSVDPTAGTTYFEYGSHGLVTKIIPPAAAGQPWSFGYDAVLNRTRIVRGDTGKASYFTWDGMEQLEERDAVGTLIARFVHGRPIVPGVGSVVEVQRASAPLGSQFVHADHQGTVHKVTDAMGRVQVSYATDAFGRQIAPATGLTPTMANDVIFHGNWMTVMVGGKRLCLSPSRIYDPEIGQFLQRDRFPEFGGLLYAQYFIPNSVDPSGMQDEGLDHGGNGGNGGNGGIWGLGDGLNKLADKVENDLPDVYENGLKKLENALLKGFLSPFDTGFNDALGMASRSARQKGVPSDLVNYFENMARNWENDKRSVALSGAMSQLQEINSKIKSDFLIPKAKKLANDIRSSSTAQRLTALGSAAVLTGGFVSVYATNKKFRQTLLEMAPDTFSTELQLPISVDGHNLGTFSATVGIADWKNYATNFSRGWGLLKGTLSMVGYARTVYDIDSRVQATFFCKLDKLAISVTPDVGVKAEESAALTAGVSIVGTFGGGSK